MLSSKRSKRRSISRRSSKNLIIQTVIRFTSFRPKSINSWYVFALWEIFLLFFTPSVASDTGTDEENRPSEYYAQGGSVELSDKDLHHLTRDDARLHTKIASAFPVTIPSYYIKEGRVGIYASDQADAIPLTVILKLTDDRCSKAEETYISYQDTYNEDPVVAIFYPGDDMATADTVVGAGFRLRNLARRRSRIVIKYIDLNAAIAKSGETCRSTGLSNTVRGMPQCIAPDDGSHTFDNEKYLKVFGEQAYTRCIVNNGSPCNTKNRGYGNIPYHHLYGCYECTLGKLGFCSHDHFSIRPKKFDANLSGIPTFRAGRAVYLSFLALDANGTDNSNDHTHRVLDYNETQDRSFALDLNVSNSTHCQLKNLTISPEIHFHNGGHDGLFTFNDIGNIHISIHEINGSEFASVDANDTPLHQRLIEAYNANFRVIPDHFELNATLSDHHIEPGTRFTYLSSDLNMSSVLKLNITSQGADNITTVNYTDHCYASPLDMNLSIGYPDEGTKPYSLNQLLYLVDESNSTYTAEGNTTEISGINLRLPSRIFPSSDHNGSTTLTIRLNFGKKYNTVINPFVMKVTELNITAADQRSEITKGMNIPDGNATYYFARTKASRYLYDVENSPADTPISVVIYYEPADSSFDPDLTTFIPTDEYDWYLSTRHSADDGKITLIPGNTSHASVTVHPALFNGLDKYVQVATTDDTRPLTVDINLTGTDSWLIYNPDNDRKPNPFYRVRFIGTSDWLGYGNTGHIVEGDLSSKKNKRLEW